MTDIYVIHLCGKDKKIVKKCENEDEVIQFITAVNKGSTYLRNQTFETFEYNQNEREDGIYVVKDGNYIKVFKQQLLTLNGYLYSSSYIVLNELNSYELIEGKTGQL